MRKMTNHQKNSALQRGAIAQRGFTLIELLLVIAIIVALAVTVFVSLNPALRLSQARDARRISDVDTLLTATHEYIVDNGGAYPLGIATSSDSMIGTCVAVATSTTSGGCNVLAGSACFNAASSSLAPYLKTIPIDPLNGTASVTDYTITIAASTSIVTIKACGAEKIAEIWSSR